MDTAQWAQGIGSMSSTTTRPQAPPPPTTIEPIQSSSHHQQQQLVERRARPVKEQALPCPRCNSTNTKFCYYNNYSLTQPRYFCKTCRRYWTEGGSLRNVPVGGGSRKNKRHSSSTYSSATKVSPNLQAPPATITSTSLPISAAKPYHGQDLNLAFPDHIIGGQNFPGTNNGGGGLSAMELLRSTGITPRGLGPLGMHMWMPETSAALYGATGFGQHDFKFPLDGDGNGHGMQEGGGSGDGGRLLFPFGDLKQVSQVKSSNEISDQENRVQGEQAIFWSGANLGGNGGSW